MNREIGSWTEVGEEGEERWLAPILPGPIGFATVRETEDGDGRWLMILQRADRLRQTTRVFGTVEEAKAAAMMRVRRGRSWQIRPAEEVMRGQAEILAARAGSEDK